MDVHAEAIRYPAIKQLAGGERADRSENDEGTK